MSIWGIIKVIGGVLGFTVLMAAVMSIYFKTAGKRMQVREPPPGLWRKSRRLKGEPAKK